MEYTKVIKEIDKLENDDFTMNSLKDIGHVAQDINYVYGSDLMNQKMDAKDNYIRVRGKLNCVVFDKLKEKLNFDDEVIYKIMSFIDIFHQINDIYVLDGNVIIKFASNKKDNEVLYLVSNDYYDVTSNKFIDGLDYNIYKEFFVNAMNRSMIPMFKEKMNKGQFLNIKNDHIEYNLNNLNIYINTPLKRIMQVNTDVMKEDIKVLIKHNDEFYYYDLKSHYAYFELAQNDYKINKLSELLKEKTKVKKK